MVLYDSIFGQMPLSCLMAEFSIEQGTATEEKPLEAEESRPKV